MNRPDQELPDRGATAPARAGLCFALLCLSLSTLAALGPRPDAGRAGLSRGFALPTVWAEESVRPAAADPKGTPPPSTSSAPPEPSRPAVAPRTPRAVHFFPAAY